MKKNKKVLIIDDDEGILLSVRVILEHEGYTVASEGDAVRALSIVKDEAPNVILLDMLLSGKDGREICKLLKKNKATKHIPVVMFSAHPTAREQAPFSLP
ncbi:response regulator, partial [Candidatus Parcubacteria bacterium]|nr:response regulator [Candidatus Parcubacteria bacterium]